MKNNDNIEKLFKDKFEHFEADVNPQVWTNVQNGIKPVSGSAASSASKFALGKIIAGAASVAMIAGSVWYFSSSRTEPASSATAGQNQTQTISSGEETPKNIASEEQIVNTTSAETTNSGSPMPPAIRSLNHYSSDDYQQTQNVSHTSTGENGTDLPGSENAQNTSPQTAKYGKAPEGPNPFLRGNQEQHSNSKISAKKNYADESQVAEQVPAVNIYASTVSGDVPLNVSFSNLGVSSALSWDFGDGATSRENTPSHTFDKPGSYVVKLVAQNSKGSNIDKVTIEVKSISSVKDNNIFTPNGDSDNDLFFLGLKNISSIEVVISNLAGATVYRWKNIDGSWDGKLANGNDAPDGLYFYAGQAIGTDGVNHPLKGSVSLSRKR